MGAHVVQHHTMGSESRSAASACRTLQGRFHKKRQIIAKRGTNMPRIETIKVSEAPPPPRKMSKVAAEIVSGINNLKKDEVLKLVPDEGKSLRGLKTSVGRISSTHGLKIESWDDGEALYVRQAEGSSTSRRSG